MQSENNVTEKPLYLKGIDDLKKDIFPMEKIIEWFTDYYGNEDVVRERLKNPPILAPLNVKEFIISQAIYKIKLSKIENLDKFFNNERTQSSHFENNVGFFDELEEALNLYLNHLNSTSADLENRRKIILHKKIVEALGFDYESIMQSLQSGKKSPETKDFLTFLKGAKTALIEENISDYFIKYYNFGVTEKKDIGLWSHIYTIEGKEIKTPDQFEKDLSSSEFNDLDYVNTWSLSEEQQEKLTPIISDEREFYNWSEEQIVAIINDAFATNHKTIDDILGDYNTDGLDILYERLYFYKNRTNYYTIDENLTLEQKANLTTLLNAKVDFNDLDKISEEYADFIIETINDTFKTNHTTLEDVINDPKLILFFRFNIAFKSGMDSIFKNEISSDKITSNKQYLEQSEQANHPEETKYAIEYFNKKISSYAIYNYSNACTMYRLEPLQISLGTIIHEFNHQMIYGSDLAELNERMLSYNKTVLDQGLGSPTRETINEFLKVRMLQNISVEDLKSYPFPIAEIDGCEYNSAVKKFWKHLTKLEETLKQCQVAGSYLPLEQKLGVEKLREFDFIVRKFYRDYLPTLSKSLDPNFEQYFKKELSQGTTV